MQTRRIKRTPMLRLWTLRYVITLCLGLITIGVLTVFWIRQTTLTNRLDNLRQFSAAAANQVVNAAGEIKIPAEFYKWIDGTQRAYKIPGQFGLTVFDYRGVSLFYKAGPTAVSQQGPPPKPLNAGSSQVSDPSFASPPPLNNTIGTHQIGMYYAITAPITHHQSVIGTIAISYSKKTLTDINVDYGLISALLCSAALFGWLVIYILLRRVTKPILAVTKALKQVENGVYRIDLQQEVKETEIYGLFVSFEGMAARLEQLEQLRTELLAGVTHELKTPITSIYGLIHAVRDEVVTGAEAMEFLDISLKETIRLEQMVSDLLDFNSFASGKISIQADSINLGKLLGEIVYQWGLIYQDDQTELRIDIPDQPFIAKGDAGRIQQIIINLLNNSKQALREQGMITITLRERSNSELEIQVIDNGQGIPEHEQINIFERYFRGENKKLAVRGLGLGLTYCKMLATAMNGSLSLKESSPNGSTFQLILPRDGK